MFEPPTTPLSTTIPLVPPDSGSVPLGVALVETTPLVGAVKPMMQPLVTL